MKIRTLALTAIALSAATTFAMASPSEGQPLKLAEVVAHMESRYPGEVVAIQFDGSGDKRAHYHVDMRFPESGLASLDIDAVTLAMASRDVAPLTAGSRDTCLRGGADRLADSGPGDCRGTRRIRRRSATLRR